MKSLHNKKLRYIISISLSHLLFVIGNLTTDSPIGQSLIASSRRLKDDNDDDGDDSYYQDYSWMSDFSIKFQGCHHIKIWNEDLDENSDVRIRTKRLARYRLCPTKSCSDHRSAGCIKGYGDYIVDVDTYVSAYTQAQRRQDEYVCQTYLYKHCDCQDGDDKGEDFNRDYCEYDCYTKGRKYNCIDKNPYVDDDANQVVNDREYEKYFEGCTQFEHKDRRLNGNGDGDYNEMKYYIGAYCADQGGKIYLGMFTDDSCTEFADKNAGRTTYKELTGGLELPYSDYSMVRTECVSCWEQDPNEKFENHDDGWVQEIRISDACQGVYDTSGKCENLMTSGPYQKNENGCSYIEGIKIVRRDGFINTRYTRPNRVVSFFIFLFAVSFVLLGAYVYYLKMKLGMKLNPYSY